MITAESMTAIRGLFVRRWVCWVLRSGYTTRRCTSADPHNSYGWPCGWRREAVLTDAEFEHLLPASPAVPEEGGDR